MGLILASLLTRTGAVRLAHPAATSYAAVDPEDSAVSAKGGGDNGGGSTTGHEAEHSHGPGLQLPFRAFCALACAGTLVLAALLVGKQNIPALQRRLSAGTIHSPLSRNQLSTGIMAASRFCLLVQLVIHGTSRGVCD